MKYKSFYFLRHGETEWNHQNIFQGHNDIPLNKNGRKQALSQVDSVNSLSNVKIFSSPLKRAKETAKLVFPGRDINFIAEFMECDSVETATFILEKKGAKDFPSFDKLKIDGESPDEFISRVEQGLKKMFDQISHETPFLVAHGGTAAAICEILNIRSFKTPNCHIFHFDLSKNEAIIKDLSLV